MLNTNIDTPVFDHSCGAHAPAIVAGEDDLFSCPED